MKIVAKEIFKGTKLNLPSLGEVEIPQDGILDIEDELAKIFVEGNIGFEYFSKDKKVETVVTSEEAETTEEAVEDDGLDSLELNDLIDLAIKSNLPENKWKKFSENTKNPKDLMVKYLRGNLTK